MKPENPIAYAIRKRILDLRHRGRLTSKGEPISLAAIARTMDPPRCRQLMYNVIDGKLESRPAKEALHRELDAVYWTLKPKEKKP